MASERKPPDHMSHTTFGNISIVFDRFHIMREMTKAVDTVRKQEHRAFRRAGADSPLTGTKYPVAV